MDAKGAPQGLLMSLDDIIKNTAKAGGRGGGRQQGGARTGGRGGAGAGVRLASPQNGGVSKPGRSNFKQGRQQQQQQQQQRGGGGRSGGGQGRGGNTRSEKDFRAIRRKAQQCFIEQSTGDVVVQYHDTYIARISPDGDIMLDSGGFHKAMTLGSFNDVLAPVGIKITAPEAGRLEDSQWLVSDGRSLYRFQDGMTLEAKGPHGATRGPLILQAFNNPSAAAATFASNVAAAEAGILPRNAPGVPLELGAQRPRGGGSGRGRGSHSWTRPQHQPLRRHGPSPDMKAVTD